MILTITLNPAVDMNYKLAEFKVDQVNRCHDVSKTAGGKGLNVSRVLKCANADLLATGFIGGKTGEFIENELDVSGISHSFVHINGNTRHCLAFMHEGKQTEILEEGPEISAADAESFINQYQRLLAKADVITASGSLPKGLDGSFYQKIITLANDAGKKFILDTSGNALRKGIKAKPYLIKPNLEELSGLLGREFHNEHECMEGIKELSSYGCTYIIVSLGKDGALAYYNGSFYKARAPKVKAVNPVGSGDAMIAGLALAISKGFAPEKTLAYGITFGSLNAMELETGFIQANLIEPYVEKVEITRLAEAV